MAGRGRGRGKGMSFNVEALGFGRGEALPGSIIQPPPLFPLQIFKPVPLLQGDEYTYMLALKQEIRGSLKESPFYIKPLEKKRDIERYSDKYHLNQQETNSFSWTPDWRFLPAELKTREKKVKRIKAVIKPKLPTGRMKKDEEVAKTFEELEKKEQDGANEDDDDKDEDKEDQDDAEEEEVFDDEEVEEETDYVLPYFDNGEGYEDEDDVDEGPIY